MWVALILFIISLVVSLVLAPKQRVESPKAGSIDQPNSKEGQLIPILFGSPRVNGPIVTWHGDVGTIAVRQEGGKK